MPTESIDDLFARWGPAYRSFVTVVGMSASFIMVISGTVVNVAVPDVMGSYGIGLDQAQLMTTAFNVAMTASQLLNAWVIAVFGRRYGFCATLALFAVGSVIGGVANSFGMIVFGRVLQGVAAGIVQPLVMVTIFAVFPANRRGFAMSVYAIGLVLAIGIGPTFGGIAIDTLGWRYIFWAPLPLVAAAFLLGLVFMPSERSEASHPFDWTGYLLIGCALFCFMTALTDGLRKGWVSDYILGLAALGALTATAFVISQFRHGPTLLDLSLFRNRQFAIAALVAFIFGVGNFGTGYAVPVFTQLVQGMSAFDAGLVMLPASLLVMVLLPFTGRLADSLMPRIGIIAGLLLFSLGTLPMVYADANTPFIAIVLYAVVSRCGMSFTMPFIMGTAMRSLRSEQLNAGGGTMNFFRQLGGSLGLNAWVMFQQVRTQVYSEALTATQNAGNSASRRLIDDVGKILGETGVPDSAQTPGALHYLGEIIHAQATAFGFQDGFMMLAVSFLLAMIPAWMLGNPRAHSDGATA